MGETNPRTRVLAIIGVVGVISLVLTVFGAFSNSPYTVLAPFLFIAALIVGVITLVTAPQPQMDRKAKRSIGKYADIDDFVDDLTTDELAYLRHRLAETDAIEVDEPPIDAVRIDDNADVHTTRLR